MASSARFSSSAQLANWPDQLIRSYHRGSCASIRRMHSDRAGQLISGCKGPKGLDRRRIQRHAMSFPLGGDSPFPIARRHHPEALTRRRCPQGFDVAFHGSVKDFNIEEGCRVQRDDEGTEPTRCRKIRPGHRSDIETQLHACEHSTQDLGNACKPCALEAEFAAERRQHVGHIGIGRVIPRSSEATPSGSWRPRLR